MITINSRPSTITFAGNPILFTGTSTIKNQSFAIIRAVVTTSQYSEEYCYPLGSDGAFQFDLSDALTEAFRQRRLVSSVNGVPSHTASAIEYNLTLIEEYYSGGVTTRGEQTTATVGADYFAIDGALTDNERQFLANNNITNLLGTGKLLTRKPQRTFTVLKKDGSTYENVIASNDICLKGMTHIIPYIKVQSGNPVPSYSRTVRNAVGRQTVTPISGCSRSIYVVDADNNLLPIIFWNGFGMLESICAYTIPSQQHNITTSQYDVQPSTRTFNTIGSARSTTTLQSQQLTLDSGIVDTDWYEWWVSEFLASPQVFVYLNGRWQPGTIVPNTSIKHDGGKGEPLHVEFGIKLSAHGSILNGFV